MLKIKEGLTFDDVLLEPRHSEITTRSNIDLGVVINKPSYFTQRFSMPIIPANMKSIVGNSMIEASFKLGGLSVMHRFLPIEEQLAMVVSLTDIHGAKILNNLAFSVGVGIKEYPTVTKFYKAGVKIICIDIAHGDSKHCIDMANHIRREHPDMLVIAGNVATGQGAARLWDAGADIVKVGVGPGSLCTTRIETGNGVPQLSALMEVYEMRKQLKIPHRYIISDGGIKNAGDCVKALCFADMVMAGNIFAGTKETPGDTIDLQGKEYKRYDGSSTHKTNHIEGVTSLVTCKGSVQDIFLKLSEGIRSGCSYQGANNLTQLKLAPQFVRITNAGLIESKPHDVIVI